MYADILTPHSIWLLVDSSSVGGIERHVQLLAQARTLSGAPVEIVLLKDHGASPWLQQLAAAGLAPRFLDGTFGGVLRAMQRQRPCLVHTHGYKAGIVGRLAAAMCRVPAVSTFHSGERPGWPLNFYYWLDRLTSITAERIAVSSDIADRLPYRATHIPNFVDRPLPPKDNALPPAVAFVGRLSHEKAPDWFCEIARGSKLPVSWHVYGDGPMRGELEREFGDKVVFHGVVADMTCVWQKVGLLLMPSRFEGLPFAALEAHGAGIPVAASRVGDVGSVVSDGETGWLFAPGDLSAGSAAVSAWFEARTIRGHQLQLACWQRVAERFSTDIWLPKVVEVYEQALARRTGQRRPVWLRGEVGQ